MLPSGKFPWFLLRKHFKNTLPVSPFYLVHICLTASQYIMLFFIYKLDAPTKLSSWKVGVVIVCVSLAHSRHLSLLHWSELNLSCIISVGVCLCHPSSFLAVLTSSAAVYGAKTHPCPENTKYYQHIPIKGIGRMRQNMINFHMFPNFILSWPIGQHDFPWLLGYTGRRGSTWSFFSLFRKEGIVLHCWRTYFYVP